VGLAAYFAVNSKARIMATIDKELLKQIVNAKKPRNYIFVEGSNDKVLVVSKSKIGKEEEKAAMEKAKGKVTSRGKIQVEQGNDGKKKVVFMAGKVNESLVPKLRRALKQQVGLSRVVEMRPQKDDDEDQGDNANIGNNTIANNGNGDNAPQVKPQRGPFETEYRKSRKNLLEEIEALKILNPKAVAKIEKKLQEAEKGLGPQKDGDKRFKSGAKSLSKLSASVAKLKTKPTKEQEAISDRARYKTMRSLIVYQIHAVNSVDKPLATQCLKAVSNEADALIAESLPESKRNYAKAFKALEKTKKLLDQREQLAKKNREPLEAPDRKSSFNVFITELREAKQLLAKFADYVPTAKELPSLRQLVDRATEENRVFDHDRARKTLETMNGQLQPLVIKYESTARSIEITRAMLRQSQNMTAPRIPQRLVKTFSDYMHGADAMLKQNRLDDALAGARDLEQRIRQALTDRKMFVDSADAIDKLLDKAFANLDEYVAEHYEKRYLDAYLKFEYGDFGAGYDEVTKVEADLTQELRKVPENVKVPKNKEIDSTAQAPEIQQGTSENARRFKFKLNVEGVRRGFGFLQEKAPLIVPDFEKWLEDVLKLEGEDFGKAENELDDLVSEMNEATKIARLVMPNEKYPQSKPPRRTPPPPPPETTKEWSQRIDKGKLRVNTQNTLGSGGQGSILKVESFEPNTPPLVMKVPPSSSMAMDDYSDIETEAKNYELVGDHPNIIKSLGMQTIGGKKGLVLEQVQGTGFDNVTGNLKTRLAKGEITHSEFWGSIQFTLSKTLEVLDHLHSKGLVNNDVKPENIMIDETTGDVKVIDLGTVNRTTEDPGETSVSYRAPELQHGSTPQTDVFSTGASAFEMVEGETFHYGRKEDLAKAGFKSQCQEIVDRFSEFIGTDEEDDMAIQLESQINPLNQKVTPEGKSDPQGTEVKRNSGVTAGKGAYTEFVNWLLHPDPKKRPSAKEALQHPFLRDRMLTDDQVKGMLRKNMVDPPPEQQGKEPLRKLVADGEKGQHENAQQLVMAQDLIKKFKIDGLRAVELLKMRDTIDGYLNTGSSARRRIENGVRALEDITSKAQVTNSPEFFKDQTLLNKLKDALEEWVAADMSLNRCLLRVNIALTKQELPGDDPNSEGLTPEAVTQRIQKLKNSVSVIARDEESAFNKAAPAYEKLQNIRGFVEQLDSLKGRNEIEKKLIVRFVKANQGGKQQDSAVAAAREFQEHVKEIELVRAKIISHIEDLQSDLEFIAQDITYLEDEAKEVFFNIEAVAKEAKEDGLKYEALAKKPRNTQEEMKKFEESRLKFNSAQEKLRELLQQTRGVLEHFLVRSRDLGLQMGPLAPSGMENLPGRLAALDKRLKAVIGKSLS